jgi:hypothetical protein
MLFVVSTQTLENYGAHAASGRYSQGEAYWKFKGGTDYVVSGLEREQDAVAFVAAIASCNDIGYKEFPVQWQSYEQWRNDLPEGEYGEHLYEQAVHVDPSTYKKS